MIFFAGIITQLVATDEKLLLLLNRWHTPFLDQLMWMVSDKWVWVPLYVLLAGLIVRRYSWKCGLLCLLIVVLAVAATDQTCASLLRPLVERLRPSNPNNSISTAIHIINGYRGGRFGFPSCHAANSCALAVFVSCCFRRMDVTLFMLVWAVVVAYSRIYLGVHYPGDIVAGMMIGGLYGSLFYGIYCKILLFQKRDINNER